MIMKHWAAITVVATAISGCGGDSSSSSGAGCDLSRIQGWWTGTYDVAWQEGMTVGANWAVEIKGDAAHFVGTRDRFRFSAPVKNCRMNARVRSELLHELCQIAGTSAISIQFNGSKAKGRFEGNRVVPGYWTNDHIEGKFRGRKR